MPMYNLLEYSKNYKKTACSLWNYCSDEPSDPLSSNFESFKYKTSITRNRDSFSHYYVPNAEIKDFNVLIDGKTFFDLPVKNEEENYEKIIDMSNNNDYKTGNLLDFAL